MFKKMFLIALFIGTSLCFAYEPPTITVNVVGQFEREEVRVVEIHISEKALDAAEVSKLVLEKQNGIEAALYELGISENSITSGNHNSYFEDNEYFARKTMLVYIPENVDIQALCQAAINAGAAGYSDFASHGFMEGAALNELNIPKTLEEAVILAEKKAGKLANAFGGDIGNIVSIKELSYGGHNAETISFEITYKLLY